jgi:hypothetical protein
MNRKMSLAMLLLRGISFNPAFRKPSNERSQHMKKVTILAIAVALFAAPAALHAAENTAGAGDSLNLSVTNATVSVKTGAVSFQGGLPGVEIMIGKDVQMLAPAGDGVESAADCQTPMGPAHARTWSWNDPRGYAYTWTVSQLANWPGYTMKMTFSNKSNAPVRLRKMVLFKSGQGAVQVTGDPSDWFLSTLDSHDSAQGGFNPSGDLATDAKRRFLDTLTLFTERGAKGLVVGAVGPAEANVRFLCDVSKGRMSLEVSSDMSDIIVDPGETRRSEEVLVLAAPYDAAIANLLRWMAITHGSRTARGPVFGWCSWYSCTTKITEKDVSGIVDVVAANRDRLPMQVIQIDDGWQNAWGDWTPDLKKFPNGMKPIADKITAAGMIPGIWLCMVRSSPKGMHPDGATTEFLDSTHPAVREFIRKTLRARYAEGYRYFKLDFVWPRIKDRQDQKMTQLQVTRDLFRQFREAIGEDSYMCACVGGLNRGAIGFADSQRIATDSCIRWRGMYVGPGIPDTINGIGNMALTQGVLFAADPDATYTLPELYVPPKHNVPPHMPEALRAWHSYVGLLGGCMMTSDLFQTPPWNSPAAMRMMEILNPPAPEKGRAFDGQTDPWHRQFGFAAVRPWGNFVSVVLLNPAEQPANAPIRGVPLTGLGKKFHVWSFWDEKYLGIADEEFSAVNVPSHGGILLRLTELSKNEAPVLVGSNFHIGMGSAEIKDIATAPGQLRITLTDGGAREGGLFIYSKNHLAAKTANGCTVKAVEAVGENVWKIHVEGRQRGKPQNIILEIGTGNDPSKSTLPDKNH